MHTCTYCGEEVDVSPARTEEEVAELLLAHLRLACTRVPEPTDLDASVGRMAEAVASAELATRPGTGYFDAADLVSMGGVILHTHHERACAGRPCCIHRPSAHHMRTWEQAWSQQLGAVFRRCPHGRFHVDPDDLRSRGAALLHECDGCCLSPSRPEGW